MKRIEELRRTVKNLDHKSYGMYKSLAGTYDYGKYLLHIDHVQGDPFASPSRLRLEIPEKNHGFPREYYQTRVRRLALEDQVLRQFNACLRKRGQGNMGSGKSGRITSCRTGQTVQERIAVQFSPEKMELRFEMGFPARGRSILAREMEELLFGIIPELAGESMLYANWEKKAVTQLKKSIALADDQEALREEMKKQHLAAFVADGAVLPRESGVSDLPMNQAVPFTSPQSLRREITLPHRGKITGMGIPEGITVIAGGGYHGKSTLLKALEQGVYDHISGDGREYVLAEKSAMKIRAEDGRSVLHTDISLFINHLPNGQNTVDFSTENASGSTSQAANLVEALETGSTLLLLDEDTSATNFMIRDQVMSRLVSEEKEPITTLLKRMRTLYEEYGISFILVVGSSGDYLSVADHVLQMDHYEVKDVTAQAKKICAEEGILHQYPAEHFDFPVFSRTLRPAQKGRIKIKTAGTDTVCVDREVIDVRYLEQLVDDGQTIGLAYMLSWILTRQKKEMSVRVLAEEVYHQIEKQGFQAIVPPNYSCGQPVLPRKQEWMACVNRYRKAEICRK